MTAVEHASCRTRKKLGGRSFCQLLPPLKIVTWCLALHDFGYLATADTPTTATLKLSDSQTTYGAFEFSDSGGLSARIQVTAIKLDRPVFASLRDIPDRIDIVDIFRRPAEVPTIVEDAIAIGAGAVWMQLTVINTEAARRARAAGLTVVMDRCLKVEHGRHVGQMHCMGFSTGIISARRRPPGS